MLSVLLGMSRLAADLELTAMMAGGINPLRIARMPILAGAVVSLISIPMAHYVAPASFDLLYERLVEVSVKNLTQTVQPGTFVENLGGITLYADARDEDWLGSVILYDERDRNDPVLLLAERARLMPQADKSILIELEEGEIHRGTDTTSARYERVRFSRAELALDTRAELKERMRVLSNNQRLRSADMVAEFSRLPPEDRHGRRLARDFWRRFSFPAMSFFFALIGAALALRSGPRRRVQTTIVAVLCVVGYYLLTRVGDYLVLHYPGPASSLRSAPTSSWGRSASLCCSARGTRGAHERCVHAPPPPPLVRPIRDDDPGRGPPPRQPVPARAERALLHHPSPRGAERHLRRRRLGARYLRPLAVRHAAMASPARPGRRAHRRRIRGGRAGSAVRSGGGAGRGGVSRRGDEARPRRRDPSSLCCTRGSWSGGSRARVEPIQELRSRLGIRRGTASILKEEQTWFKGEAHMVRVQRRIDSLGQRLEDVLILSIEGSALTERWDIETMRWSEGRWGGTGVVRRTFLGAGRERPPLVTVRSATMAVSITETPRDFVARIGAPPYLSWRELKDALETRERVGRPTAAHRFELHHRLSGPLSLVLVMLLACGVALRLGPRQSLAAGLGAGTAVGCLAWMIRDVAGLLGNTTALHVPIAAHGVLALPGPRRVVGVAARPESWNLVARLRGGPRALEPELRGEPEGAPTVPVDCS